MHVNWITTTGKDLPGEAGPLSDEPEAVGDTVCGEQTACWSEIGALSGWGLQLYCCAPAPQRRDLQRWEDRLSQRVLKEKPSLFPPGAEVTLELYSSLAQAAEGDLINTGLWDGRARCYKWRLLGCRCHRATASYSCNQKAFHFPPPWGPGSLKPTDAFITSGETVKRITCGQPLHFSAKVQLWKVGNPQFRTRALWREFWCCFFFVLFGFFSSKEKEPRFLERKWCPAGTDSGTAHRAVAVCYHTVFRNLARQAGGPGLFRLSWSASPQVFIPAQFSSVHDRSSVVSLFF